VIMHLVTFRWRDDVTEDRIRALIDELGRFQGAIPQLHAYFFGRDLGLRAGNGDFGAAAVVHDAEGLHGYLDHPEHRRVVNQYIRQMSAHRLAVQIELPSWPPAAQAGDRAPAQRMADSPGHLPPTS
jgi:hypothetical protein